MILKALKLHRRESSFIHSLFIAEITIPYISGPQPFWHQGQVLWKTIFPRTGVGDGFRMIQAHYIYCALYFYYYYTVIYNEIIIQLTIIQNQ